MADTETEYLTDDEWRDAAYAIGAQIEPILTDQPHDVVVGALVGVLASGLAEAGETVETVAEVLDVIMEQFEQNVRELSADDQSTRH